MIDTVDADTRSRMMSGIRSSNTKPEILIRKALHRRGFRYRIHVRALPGHPDIVLPKFRAVVFIHGCFWHGHGCRLFKWPATRPDFWRAKIERNQLNDLKAVRALREHGWRVAVIWECAIRHVAAAPESLVDRLACWLNDNNTFLEISE